MAWQGSLVFNDVGLKYSVNSSSGLVVQKVGTSKLEGTIIN